MSATMSNQDMSDVITIQVPGHGDYETTGEIMAEVTAYFAEWSYEELVGSYMDREGVSLSEAMNSTRFSILVYWAYIEYYQRMDTDWYTVPVYKIRKYNAREYGNYQRQALRDMLAAGYDTYASRAWVPTDDEAYPAYNAMCHEMSSIVDFAAGNGMKWNLDNKSDFHFIICPECQRDDIIHFDSSGYTRCYSCKYEEN